MPGEGICCDERYANREEIPSRVVEESERMRYDNKGNRQEGWREVRAYRRSSMQRGRSRMVSTVTKCARAI